MNLKHFGTGKIIKLAEVGSTNSYLQNLNSEFKQNCGTVVLADFQTEGKGQKGNVWKVNPGENLTFSVVVYPQIHPKYAFYLNIITSLAVQKTLTDLKIDSQIKWPNDILVNTNKIGGILVENQISGSKIAQSIIGIGLNINQTDFGDVLKATSVKQENVNVEVEDVFNQIHSYLDFYYNLLLESNFNLLLKHYYMHLFWMDEEGIFEDADGKFRATVMGITEVGLLKLKTSRSQIKTYDLKEIKFVY